MVMENYVTLEEELVRVFKKRGLRVKTIEVRAGATHYVITLEERGKKRD